MKKIVQYFIFFRYKFSTKIIRILYSLGILKNGQKLVEMCTQCTIKRADMTINYSTTHATPWAIVANFVKKPPLMINVTYLE